MAGLERGKGIGDYTPKIICFDISPISVRSRRKSGGDTDPFLVEIAHHLAERCVLAADACHIAASQLLEPDHVLGVFGHGILLRSRSVVKRLGNSSIVSIGPQSPASDSQTGPSFQSSDA